MTAAGCRLLGQLWALPRAQLARMMLICQLVLATCLLSRRSGARVRRFPPTSRPHITPTRLPPTAKVSGARSAPRSDAARALRPPCSATALSWRGPVNSRFGGVARGQHAAGAASLGSHRRASTIAEPAGPYSCMITPLRFRRQRRLMGGESWRGKATAQFGADSRDWGR